MGLLVCGCGRVWVRVWVWAWIFFFDFWILVSFEKLKRFKSIPKIKKYSKDQKVYKVNFEILWPWFLVFSF